MSDVTDLEHNDEGQPGRQDVPELQSVRVRLSRVGGLPVVTIPGGPNRDSHTGHKAARMTSITDTDSTIHRNIESELINDLCVLFLLELASGLYFILK